MGGCATKPKVLTGEGEAEAPAPAPAQALAHELAKEEVAAAPDEPAKVDAASEVPKEENKEKGVEVVEEEKKVVEIVGAEQEDKPRSLSNLFKVNEGKEGEAEAAEPVKQEVSKTEKPKEESETKQLEAMPQLSEPVKDEPSKPENPKEEHEIKVEPEAAININEAPLEFEQTTTIPAVVVDDIPAKPEAEKVVDVTPTPASAAAETHATQTSEEKKTEESK